MEDRKPPTWDEIRGLIDRVDAVCRESEQVRAHAERIMRRPKVWPDRRKSRQHSTHSFHRREDDATPQGSNGEL
jgi:hypothetical protein